MQKATVRGRLEFAPPLLTAFQKLGLQLLVLCLHLSKLILQPCTGCCRCLTLELSLWRLATLLIRVVIPSAQCQAIRCRYVLNDVHILPACANLGCAGDWQDEERHAQAVQSPDL